MNIDELPDQAKQLVEVLGLADALRVISIYGGTTIAISQQSRKDIGTRLDIIQRLLGKKKTDALVERFAGMVFYIPRCTQALKRERDRQICADSDAGMAIAELMAKHALGERQIWRILKASADKPGTEPQAA